MRALADKSIKKNAAGMGMMGGNLNSLFKRPEKSWRPAAILLLFEVLLAHLCRCPCAVWRSAARSRALARSR